MNRGRSITIGFMALLIILGQNKAYSEEKSAAGEEFLSEGGYFKIDLPPGWSKAEQFFGLSAEEKKVYGIDLLGPVSPDNITSRIAVHYYAPGNIIHRTMDRFIKLNAQSALGANLDGEEYSPVKDEPAAGRPAKVFGRKTYEYLPPETINPKKIPIREWFVVIPAKQGFYVLRYSAGEDIAEQYRDVFEKVVNSFKPLVE